MKIVLWGVQTNNKGAELMLYAILQEIERRFPDATVYLPYSRMKQGPGYVKTNLDFRYSPFSKMTSRIHLHGIFRHLHLPMKILWSFDLVKGADWFIDGSGFAFSDQFNMNSESVNMWQYKLNRLHRHNCKIVFLPQAFGPVELSNTKKALSILSQNASVIMPREKVSYDYLKDSGVVNMDRVRLFTDFTSLVEGVFPQKYNHLRNGICIIPNMKMIDKGSISYDDYIHLLTTFIEEGKKSGHVVYLLNHEGLRDELLANRCRESIGGGIEVVTGLNALEVKGLIASAYLVITSRFHGVASALNSCVPCLATSWSHKYQELYNDYNMHDCVLPLDNDIKAIEQIRQYLNTDKNLKIRNILNEQVPHIKDETREMWKTVWSI